MTIGAFRQNKRLLIAYMNAIAFHADEFDAVHGENLVPPSFEDRIVELERLIEQQRHVWQRRLFRRSDLHQRNDQLFGDVARLRGHVARIGVRATPFDLLALHGEIDVLPARIASDDLEFRAQHIVHERRHLYGGRARARRADLRHALLGVLEGLGLRRVPDGQHLRRIAHVADPVELPQIGLEGRVEPERLIGRQSLADHGEDRAVFWREFSDPVGRHDAAAARHVDRHDRRIAGDVAPHVAGEKSGILVVTAAGRRADDHLHLAAGPRIEI